MNLTLSSVVIANVFVIVAGGCVGGIHDDASSGLDLRSSEPTPVASAYSKSSSLNTLTLSKWLGWSSIWRSRKTTDTSTSTAPTSPTTTPTEPTSPTTT